MHIRFLLIEIATVVFKSQQILLFAFEVLFVVHYYQTMLLKSISLFTLNFQFCIKLCKTIVIGSLLLVPYRINIVPYLFSKNKYGTNKSEPMILVPYHCFIFIGTITLVSLLPLPTRKKSN